ncbi:DUF1656 domain-containing protein [Paraburkholderia panacisoli]|uniref:DUF1656 domain-containing protein n=1 Tax=Paraburkholderia panacisoli TaxID=2603818 RepID=A0A5B0GPN2_9BURK|nr:DUF1656 domain-containing protein [Paraburkholderia panacisoli]KAA1004861.1 DUF1656 domain-containing protein [Paraburkholderia panacisoli]
MSSDLDFFGVFLPPMVLVAAASFVILQIMKRLMVDFHLYGFISHRNVFDIALYFIIVAGILFTLGGKTILPLFF